MHYLYHAFAGIALVEFALCTVLYYQRRKIKAYRANTILMLEGTKATQTDDRVLKALEQLTTDLDERMTKPILAALQEGTNTVLDAFDRVRVVTVASVPVAPVPSVGAAYVDDYIGRDQSKDDPDVLWSRSFGGEVEVRDD